jgi:hypothetical protein
MPDSSHAPVVLVTEDSVFSASVCEQLSCDRLTCRVATDGDVALSLWRQLAGRCVVLFDTRARRLLSILYARDGWGPAAVLVVDPENLQMERDWKDLLASIRELHSTLAPSAILAAALLF